MRGRIEDAQRRLETLAARSDAQRARLVALARRVVSPGGVAGVGVGLWRALGPARPWVVAGAVTLVVFRPMRVISAVLRWWPALTFARRVFRGLPSREGSPRRS